jgi:hypothetical protein
MIAPSAVILNAIISTKGVSLQNALQMKSPISNDISPCSYLEARGHVGGTKCLHFRG